MIFNTFEVETNTKNNLLLYREGYLCFCLFINEKDIYVQRCEHFDNEIIILNEFHFSKESFSESDLIKIIKNEI